MKRALTVIIAVFLTASATMAEEKPLHIFIRAGRKTHGPGDHDYPRFHEEWTKLLSERGAVASGSLTFPKREQLQGVDVMIIYAPDGGTMNADERKTIDSFTQRGGGLVVLHDGICGNDADWFKTVLGGAKQHGVTNWRHGRLELNLKQLDHPITKGLANLEMDDELFYRLHLMPEITTLATAIHDGKEVPQLWCYERSTDGGKYRAFVSLQGHKYATFSTTPYRGILLRGIAWAAKRDPETLTRREDFSH